MPLKNQHYVPRVYLKSWETTVYSKREPNKPFQGVYKFENNDFETGDGITKENVLSQNHTYTIDFQHTFIIPFCPQVRDDFGAKIDAILKQRNVYVLLGSTALNTYSLLGENLNMLDKWMLYSHATGQPISPKNEKAIKNQIRDIRSYVLEDAFSAKVENSWTKTMKGFIGDVQKSLPDKANYNLRKISVESAMHMVEMTFYMAFRNPEFDCLGVYSAISNTLFNVLANGTEDVEKKCQWQSLSNQMHHGMWLTEISKALFHQKGAFQKLCIETCKRCKIILFEVETAEQGQFITSDNPSFWYNNCLERENHNGIYFPLSPQHLLLFAQGNDGDISTIDYRTVRNRDIRTLNRIIANSSIKTIVSNCKHLGFIL